MPRCHPICLSGLFPGILNRIDDVIVFTALGQEGSSPITLGQLLHRDVRHGPGPPNAGQLQAGMTRTGARPLHRANPQVHVRSLNILNVNSPEGSMF